jgi:hypothetical protein
MVSALDDDLDRGLILAWGFALSWALVIRAYRTRT